MMPGGMLRIGHPHRSGAHDDYADAIALISKEIHGVYVNMVA